MKILLLALSIIFCINGSAQKTITIDDANSKARILNGSFRAITVSDGITLYLTAASAESLAVSFADEKYEARFKTEVENGVLKIYFDHEGINYSDNNRRKLKAYVSFKTLEKLSASGGSDVQLPSQATIDHLEMKFSSGAHFSGEIKGNDISIEQSSGSMVEIRGTCVNTKIDVSSGAIFKGYELAVGYCEAKASSGSAIRVFVEKELSAHAGSGGEIRFKGEGIIKEINTDSGGSVKKV